MNRITYILHMKNGKIFETNDYELYCKMIDNIECEKINYAKVK